MFSDHDGIWRRQEPHLRVSISYLHRIFDYLAANDIRMYRMSSDIAPYVTHPDLPRFHGQIDECAGELRALGERVHYIVRWKSRFPEEPAVVSMRGIKAGFARAAT